MKRINKEVLENEVRYTYEVDSKKEASIKVLNSSKYFKGSYGAFSGYNRETNTYTVTVQYAR